MAERIDLIRSSLPGYERKSLCHPDILLMIFCMIGWIISLGGFLKWRGSPKYLQGKLEMVRLALLGKLRSVLWHWMGKNYVLSIFVWSPLASAKILKMHLIVLKSY
jgi:hypothetical protein